MQVTMTIYRRGVNWQPMPKHRHFLAWTDYRGRLVLKYDGSYGYYCPAFGFELVDASEVVAWADIPKLETKR